MPITAMGSCKVPGFQREKQEATRPKLVELRSSRWFIMFVVSFAAATDVFMYGLIVPVTPTALQNRVGLSERSVQGWTSVLLALFSAALLAFSPIVGYIADRSESRRRPLLFGLVALGAATALLCVGTNIGLWVAGRLFQGTAAAVVWVVGIALMVDTVGKDGLGQAMGYVSMAISFGTLTGPLLGGVLYQDGGYYAVFGLAFGFIGLDIFLRLVLIERKHAIKWLVPDNRPLAAEQQATEKGAGENPTSSPTPSSGSDNQDPPKDPPSRSALWRVAFLLSSPRLIVALWGNFIISLCPSTIRARDIRMAAKRSGTDIHPAHGTTCVGPVAGFIIDKFPRSGRYITAGAFLSSVPVMVLLRLVTDNSMQHKILLCALLALLGLCFAVVLPPLDAEVFHAVKEKEDQTPDLFGRGGAMALAFGLSNMGFAAGSLIGPVFAGFIRQQAGWGTMGWALGLMAGVSSIPILLFLGGWILGEPVRSGDEAQVPESASGS
ncbi:major facilitator superfamily domain-containing protein [Lipomyces starkeyi]